MEHPDLERISPPSDDRIVIIDQSAQSAFSDSVESSERKNISLKSFTEDYSQESATQRFKCDVRMNNVME